jgi:hypothetical protein
MIRFIRLTISLAILVNANASYAESLFGCWTFSKFKDDDSGVIHEVKLEVGAAEDPKHPLYETDLTVIERKTDKKGRKSFETSGGTLLCRTTENKNELDCSSDEGRANLQMVINGSTATLSIVYLNTIDLHPQTKKKIGVTIRAPEDDPYVSTTGKPCKK